MNKGIALSTASMFLFAILLSACGTPHVRTDKSAADLHDYENIFIDDVNVHSHEKSAKTNRELQSKMIEWERFARRELEGYVEKSHYSLVERANEGLWGTLVINLDIDLVYGNRATRYFVGFGAGKGSVDSVLTVIDPITRDEKLHVVAESDLSVGVFGGDMESVLKENIKLLVQQYPPAPPSQNVQPSSQVVQPSSQRVQPSSQRVEPSTKNVQPSIQKVPPLRQIEQPSIHEVQPSIQEVQPSIQEVQPSIQEVKPSSQRVQSSSQRVQGNQATGKPNYIIPPRPSALKAVHARDKDDCEFITSITKNVSGVGDVSTFVKSARNSALTEAVNNRADSYFIVNAEANSSGASVTLEALKCK